MSKNVLPNRYPSIMEYNYINQQAALIKEYYIRVEINQVCMIKYRDKSKYKKEGISWNTGPM